MGYPVPTGMLLAALAFVARAAAPQRDCLLQDGRCAARLRRAPSGARGASRGGHPWGRCRGRRYSPRDPDEPRRPGQSRLAALTSRIGM
jgi:hypothetical protein